MLVRFLNEKLSPVFTDEYVACMCTHTARANIIGRLVTEATHRNIVFVLAKVRMGPRTIPIPLSSEAFSWMDVGQAHQRKGRVQVEKASKQVHTRLTP